MTDGANLSKDRECGVVHAFAYQILLRDGQVSPG